MRVDGATTVVRSRRSDQHPFTRGREGRPVVRVGLGRRVEGAGLFPTPCSQAVMIHAACGFEAFQIAGGGVPPVCADQRAVGGHDDRRAESVAAGAVAGLEDSALHPVARCVALVCVDGTLGRSFGGLVGPAAGGRSGAGHPDQEPVAVRGQAEAEVGAAESVEAALRRLSGDLLVVDRARGRPCTAFAALEDV